MTQAQRPARRGRPPAGQSALSREAILEAAMTLLDDGDIEELSMRTVARALGVDPKSLYNHVENKDALLTGIVELILSRMRVPELTGILHDDLPSLANALRIAVLAGHPRAARLLLTRPIESVTNLAPMDAVLAVFLRAGATPEQSVHFLRIAFAFMTGTLLREADSAITFALNDAAAAVQRRTTLEKSELPSVQAAAQFLATCDHAKEFEFGVTMLADTFARQLESVDDQRRPCASDR